MRCRCRATRELPVRRSRFCVDTGLRATTFASVASALLCVSDEPPDAQRARRLGPGRLLRRCPTGWGAKAPPVGASSTVKANRAGPRASCPLNQEVEASPPSPLPASGGATFMPIKSIASGGRAPPERAPPPCKRSGVSGGPASSPNVVPAFTLPPGSPLSIAPALPLKQEAPSPIGAPRAAPTSIPSRCAHRTLSPKRLRRPTSCRCAAGRAAERSEAARTVGTSGGFGGPEARLQVAIAEPQ